MSYERVRSCPFCGSQKVNISRTNENACWVECDNCDAQTSSHPSRVGAIAKWNKRSRKIEWATIGYDDDKQP